MKRASFWWALPAITLLICPCVGRASTAGRTAYYYQDPQGQWCAMMNHRRYMRLADAAGAKMFDMIAGAATYSGARPTSLDEYQTNAEAEQTLLVHYSFDARGQVVSARITYRYFEGEGIPFHRDVYDYAVADGVYRGKSAQATRELKSFSTLRRARSIGDFPVARALKRALRAPGGRPFCG